MRMMSLYTHQIERSHYKSQVTSSIYTIGEQMTHDELLKAIDKYSDTRSLIDTIAWKSLKSVVELCDKWESKGSYCLPIEDVIKAIEKEIK